MTYERLFWFLARTGRSFGGYRPRRITNWIADHAFGARPPKVEDFRWVRDRSGAEMLLHPFYVIDRDIIAFGTYDSRLQRFIRRVLKPSQVCLDVGANIGAMTLPMALRVGPTGRVHAFEPVPHIMDRLRKNVARNGLDGTVRLHEMALSDRVGPLGIQVAAADYPNQGMGSIVHDPAGPPTTRLEIRATTLDEFVQRESLNRLDFIKIDIQGAEPYFVRGATETLKTLKPDLLMEISPEDLAGCGCTGPDLVAQLDGVGYEVFEITPRGTVGSRLRSNQMTPEYSSFGVYCRAATGPAPGQTSDGRK